MKILVLGNGFIAQHLPYDRLAGYLSLDEYEIEKILDAHQPQIIINTIGKTGVPNIDQLENLKSETALANTSLPIVLANICAKRNIHFVHIGSGCIYNGPSPNTSPVVMTSNFFWSDDPVIDLGWVEEDFANPISYYGKTKYACDLVISSLPNVSILRIRMPISSLNHPRNFISKIRNYQKVIDIPNSMTFMDDLVRCINWVISQQKYGIYHVVNPEPISAARVLREYQKYVPEHQFEIMEQEELDRITEAKRSNCLLNTSKLTREGFLMTPSLVALEQAMKQYINNLGKK